MSKKDDLVSSRPISPSEYLQFPVDEGRGDVLVTGGLLEGTSLGVSDLDLAMDHPFAIDSCLNGLMPFGDAIHDFTSLGKNTHSFPAGFLGFASM